MLFHNTKFEAIIILPVISGILLGLSLLYIIHWLAWIMLIPLFYAVISKPKAVFFKGFIAGTSAGLILFSWMIPSARLYSGLSLYIGIPLWIMCSLYFGIVLGVVLKVFTLIKINDSSKHAWWINSLLAGSIWILIDWVRTRIMPGMPWMNYQLVFTQTKWVIPLQLLSFTGLWGLTFIIVVINMVFAYIWINKKYKILWGPFLVYIGLITAGFIRLNFQHNENQKPVHVALICDNLEARQRWMPETGDSLAAIFFDLNRHAVKSDPQLIVWNESALPWKLAMDDDLITKCLNITWPSQAGHIIGIHSPSEKDTAKIYNSAYYIRPDGAITSRYDKVQLLSFLEKPFLGKRLPFFSRSAHTNVLAGKRHKVFKTSAGDAGILICNETVAPMPFRKTLTHGAEFFVVMSNNSWFEGSTMNIHHFYADRIRTVESGIDMIINCNRGISGIIDANGIIQVSEKGDKPSVISGTILPAKHQSFYARYGDWLIFLVSFYLIAIIFLNQFLT